MYSDTRYEIQDKYTHEVLAEHSLPTPRLLAEGGGEAYATGAQGSKGQPMWRLRDDNYDPPGTQYRQVILVVREVPWG